MVPVVWMSHVPADPQIGGHVEDSILRLQYEQLEFERLATLLHNNFEGGSNLLNSRYLSWLYQSGSTVSASAVVALSPAGEYLAFMGVKCFPFVYEGVEYPNYVPSNVIVDAEHRNKNLFSKMIQLLKSDLIGERCFLSGYPNDNAYPFWKRHKMNFQQEMKPTVCAGLGLHRGAASCLSKKNIKEIEKYNFDRLNDWQAAQNYPVAKVTGAILLWRYLEHPSTRYIIKLFHDNYHVDGYIAYAMKKHVAIVVDAQGRGLKHMKNMFRLHPTIAILAERQQSISNTLLNKITRKQIRYFMTPINIDGCGKEIIRYSLFTADFI